MLFRDCPRALADPEKTSAPLPAAAPISRKSAVPGGSRLIFSGFGMSAIVPLSRRETQKI